MKAFRTICILLVIVLGLGIIVYYGCGGEEGGDDDSSSYEGNENDLQPRAIIDSPSSNITIDKGDSVLFQGSASSGNPPFTYSWNFDGASPNSTSEDPGSITFDSGGSFTIIFTVIDSDGDENSDSLTITVIEERDTNPEASINSPSSNRSITVGESILFQGSVSSGNAPYTYRWDFNGASSNSSQKDPGYIAFNSTGSYLVTFTVTDNDGDTDSDSVTITVEPEPIHTGIVKGYVYVTGTSDPLSGVIISIGSISDTTDSSGYYYLEDVPVGNRTITASKSDYENYSSALNVMESTTNHNIYMTSSIQTTSISGYVYWSYCCDDLPVQRATVSIGDMEDTTDSTGHYQLPNVPQGQVTIRVTAQNAEDFNEDIYLYSYDKEYNINLRADYIICQISTLTGICSSVYNIIAGETLINVDISCFVATIHYKEDGSYFYFTNQGPVCNNVEVYYKFAYERDNSDFEGKYTGPFTIPCQGDVDFCTVYLSFPKIVSCKDSSAYNLLTVREREIIINHCEPTKHLLNLIVHKE